MSQSVGRHYHRDVLGLESGLEAFHSSSEFSGPVEDLDGHDYNDHFAHIYETRAEKFEAAVPFVRHGLERGDRIMYVVDESTEQEVRAALRDGGIDVDAAVESDALSFPTVQETYLRDGSFDADEMIDFYGDTVAEATEEYEALRIVAEMTWLEDDETSVEQFMEYEQRINALFDQTDSLAICQYNRELFDPAVIRTVVQTHPHLIYDGAACHNVYYTPPEEFFGDDAPARENERMLRTLRDRTVAKTELQRRERFLRECYEITSDPARDFDEKLDALLEFGCEQFGLDYGGIARIDPDRNLFEVEEIRGDHDHLVPGEQYPLSETYCQLAVDDGETAAVTDPAETAFEDKLCHERFGVRAYLGTHLPVDGGVDRTFWFLSNEPRETAITEMEQTFIHLMGEWVRYELERQQRERELRRTKSRFETVFEQSDDGIFILDPDADEFVDANPAAAEMTGYSRDELLSQAPSDLHPDELEQFRAFLDDVRETGSAWSEDLHCRHKDGRDLPAEITASTITLDGRDLVLTLVRHIGDRKKHERYQRELYEITAATDLEFDEKLERLLELGCDRFGLEMAGLSQLPSWNGKFRLEKGAGLGVDSDEELWIDPDDDCYCRRTITEEGPVGMVDVRGTHWAEDTIYQELGIMSYLGTKVSTGTAPYGTLWFGSTEPRDRPFSVAERSFIELMGQWVSYEIERREHSDAQRKLYEITADPDLDSEEKIDRLLEAGCEHLNLPVGMLTRRREQAFEIEQMHGTHPELDEGTLTPPLTDNYCRRVVDTGESISVCDAGAAGWDGDALYHEFNLECYAGTQVTVRGENYGTVCFTDMGTREEFTEAEQAFLDLLGQCVSYEIERQQHEADLEETIDRLEQSNDRLRQFAYAASHDLQEPLRMVSSYLQLLESRYRDDLDEDAREFIDFAVDGADRMRAMIDDLLAFSRVEQATEEFEPVDCDEVLEHVIDNLQIQIEETGAEIVSESLPAVMADQEQLEQLFSNLVSNGIKYNESEQPRVEISATRRADRWEFSVADNGIGIDPDKADRIFEVFKRLHNDDEYDGTGIGLSLCQNIVDNHGGDIWVESEPAEGSTFSFVLPAADSHER